MILADEHISQATISNIDAGCHMFMLKNDNISLENLRIEDKLPVVLTWGTEGITGYEFQLYMIEVTHDTGKYQQAYERLMQMELDDDHP